MIVTVYSKPSCVQCTATYKRLDQNGIDYDVIDISQDEDARNYVIGLGHVQVPVVVAGKYHWSGYRPESIDALRDL